MYHIFPSYHYYEHPTDPNYLIFTLRIEEMADYFGQKLEEANIKFEKDTDVNRQEKTLYHFAVLQRDRDRAMDVFLKTWAAFRKPFFGHPVVKILVLIFTLSLVTLGVIGLLK